MEDFSGQNVGPQDQDFSRQTTRRGRTTRIAIVGAGLVGSLLAIYLAKRGSNVSLFERRKDMRKGNADAGRSINLALSTRGLRALDEVGIADQLKKVAIPMNGRMMHDIHGNLSFLPYGKEGQYINSISRSNLNIVLMDEAERNGAKIFFEERCINVDFQNTQLTTTSGTRSFDLIIGADILTRKIFHSCQRVTSFALTGL